MKKEMKDVDFKECEFIDECMRFVTYNQFCDKCQIIKYFYQAMSKRGKRFYKWYLYAQININLIQKDRIWNYLNDVITYRELVIFYENCYN